MGSFFSMAIKYLFGKQEIRVLINGLDAAGKTTMLYKLKLGEVVTTIPTIGFNVETVDYKNIAFTCWDVGGRGKIRPLWRHYYKGTNAMIFVIDSNDKERLSGEESGFENSAKEELYDILREDELKDIPLLIFANKQDLPNAVSVKDIEAKLELNKIKDRKWHIEGCVATTGEGLYEGLEWLSNEMKEHKKDRKKKGKGKEVKLFGKESKAMSSS